MAVIQNSPTVSALRQQRLYELLKNRAREKTLQALVPLHPMVSGAYEHLASCFETAEACLETQERENRLFRYHAYLSLAWMKGESIPSIIEASYSYKTSRGEKPKKSFIMRSVLSDVERFVRFKYVRLMGCYITILREVLNENQRQGTAERLPPLPTFLELGACEATMISLIAIGLSRSTARRLSKIAAHSLATSIEARAWLSTLDLGKISIPEISKREVQMLRTDIA